MWKDLEISEISQRRRTKTECIYEGYTFEVNEGYKKHSRRITNANGKRTKNMKTGLQEEVCHWGEGIYGKEGNTRTLVDARGDAERW